MSVAIIEKKYMDVDIYNLDSLLNILDYQLNNFDNICDLSKRGNPVEFGRFLKNSFKRYSYCIHEEVPVFSDFLLYIQAVKNRQCKKKVIEFVYKVIERNKDQMVWYDEKTPMGLNAALVLALHDKEQITLFIDLLRSCDLDKEFYQPYYIEVLLQKWRICNETLMLLAARSGSIAGRCGIEEYYIERLDDNEKKIFFKYLMIDAIVTE